MSRVARSPRRSADANPVASAPARRRRLSKEERWEEILVVAEQVFSEMGYDSATVAEVARRAGVVEGNVYRYVKTKRELLAHVISEWYSRTNAELENELRHITSVRSRLRFLIAAHLRALRDSPGLMRLIIRELRTSDTEFRAIVGKLNQRYTWHLRHAIECGVESGEFGRDIPVRLVRDMIFGGIEHHATRYLMGEGSLDVESTADQILFLLLHGVQAPPGAGNARRSRKPGDKPLT
ncbi:MAG: TetR/AcrR family transcriptional regulator [Rubrivivax sp.]|nr:TetR/AcrR family transcriptional regulator [Rubrivivax sp.]MCZ2088114.1 TetR family transcriptional regulator [Burkholderiales bacterium]TXI20985.1 MAG: TetR/AcrR family transcriptional regulator [Ottowia sp.]HMM72798.1 TetR/AcrR family transcriptional regulator [Rhodocyclaceae bacterium]HNI84740.1 TetR/AcrR family transcriptional regulator [Ottowia sp.]